VERGFWLKDGVHIRLDAIGSIPPGMVRVGGKTNATDGPLVVRGAPATDFGDFLIDRFEVSNRQFKEFVEAGGYQKTNFWSCQFVKGGTNVTRNEAMSQFRDKTGQPGPATWLNGWYPEGQGDYPVAGVSWYEAAAYAQFAGKSLPTIYHWEEAADPWASGQIVPLSNFSTNSSTNGPARVGKYQGMSPWGAYDMAGNVAEWCWNETGSGKRYVLGAAWDDRDYRFMGFDEGDPFDRLPTRGFRCMKDLSAPGSWQSTRASVAAQLRDYGQEKPVSDEVFKVLLGYFSYDKTLPLNPKVQPVEAETDSWRRQTVSFKAAYGDETVTAFLFLPKKSSPPFQTFVYFPGRGAFNPLPSTKLQDFDIVEALLRSGRAVLYPVYKGSYERASAPTRRRPSLTEGRDIEIERAKDFLRSVDYLQTRPDIIDQGKLGYAGLSYGGFMAPLLLALDGRMRIAVLVHGGLPMRQFPPEIDPLNFVHHVTIPVLMINGGLDPVFPPDASQRALLRLLGTPEEDKQWLVDEKKGHQPPPIGELTTNVRAWVDKYWGPPK
jgi:formylglycine-generating enzyme required for sulfatase activity/dienelactone hydrolase